MSIEEDLKLKLIDVIAHFHGLAKDQRDAVITALKNPATVINKEDLDRFFVELAKNEQANQAFREYFRLLTQVGKLDASSLKILDKNTRLKELFDEYFPQNTKGAKPRKR